MRNLILKLLLWIERTAQRCRERLTVYRPTPSPLMAEMLSGYKRRFDDPPGLCVDKVQIRRPRQFTVE